MKLAIRAALGAVIACAFVSAHAEATYSVGFDLDRMPLLRTGLTGYDGPGMLDGQWDPIKRFDAEVHTREQVGTTVDPVSGEVVPVWGNGASSFGKDRTSYSPHSFGMVHGALLGPNEWTQTTGRASVYINHLGVSGETRGVPAEVGGSATWNRDFWLEAGTTITFAGLATLSATGDAAAIDPVAALLGGDGHSFVSLIYGDALNRARVEVGATLFNLAAGLDAFDYTIGPGGLLSLTITNTGTERLYGNLRAGTFLDSGGNLDPVPLPAAPVPEPATWLLMLGGGALVARAARRSAQPVAEPAMA